MENRYLLAFLVIFFNVFLNIFLKGALGYKKEGVQIVPSWATKMGSSPMEIDLKNFRVSHLRQLLRNIPLWFAIICALCFFITWINLIAVAGLGFSNAAMALFFVIISIVSYYMFEEYLGGTKLLGMIVIVIGYILVVIGEYQAEIQGLIE